MGVFGRYVFRQASGAVVLILSTLIFIIWISVALRELNLMTNEGQTTGVFLYMTILALPQIIGIVMPVALLIACIHTLNKLSGDSEIIVFTAAGAGRWEVAKPLLLLGLIVTGLVFTDNAYLQPTAMRELRSYIIKVRTDLISHVLQPGVFTNQVAGLTFHIRGRDRNGDILGFFLHDVRNPDQAMTYLAERSRLIERNGTTYLVMFNGDIQRRAANSDVVQIIAFDRYVFDLSAIDAGNTNKIHYKTYESYIGELYSPPSDNPYYVSNPGTFRAELHDRLSNPFYAILFVLISVAMLGYARTTRESRMKSVALAFVIAATMRLTGLSAVNLMAKQPAAILLVWGIPLGGIVIATFLIRARGIPGAGLVLRPFKTRTPPVEATS